MSIALNPWTIGTQIKAAAVNLIISAIQEAQTNVAALQVAQALRISRISGSPIAGSAWDGVTPLLYQDINIASPTWSGGLLVINYPVAFANGVLAVHVNSLVTTAPQAIVPYGNAGLTLTQLVLNLYSAAGAPVTSGAQRMAVQVVGW